MLAGLKGPSYTSLAVGALPWTEQELGAFRFGWNMSAPHHLKLRGGVKKIQRARGEEHVVPSVRFLSERATLFVQQTLEVHEKFNLAQTLI